MQEGSKEVGWGLTGGHGCRLQQHSCDQPTGASWTAKDALLPLKPCTASYYTPHSVQERMPLNMFAEAAKVTASHVLAVHCTADVVISVEDAHALDRVIPRHQLFVVQGRRGPLR